MGCFRNAIFTLAKNQIMNINLSGKTAVICGATSGIGKASAQLMAKMGARVIAVARNEDKLKELTSSLDDSENQGHLYVTADFSHPSDLKNAINSFMDSYKGKVDILLNNTGGPPAGPANEADVEEYITAFNQHLVCNQILVQALLPWLKKAEYGRIINVISTSVKQPLNNLGVSNTVRGAVANWSKTLANELGQFNITVNNVLPGATKTPRLEGLAKNKAEKTGQSIEEVYKDMGAASPMKRVAEPIEIANAIAFLASPAASYINGINIPVDGGRTACL